MAIVTVGENSYHVDNKLMKMWSKRSSLDYLKKHNSDRWIVVDGRERIGKSSWVLQQLGAIEPALFESPEKFVSRICFSPDEFRKTVSSVKNGAVVFDEAFRGLSSRAALSKINKLLIQTMMEVGQNNNIVFIVLPSFFMLDIYPAMLRSDFLFHIDLDRKSKLRKFIGYNRDDKNKIYQMGIKKGWKYLFSTKFRGRFSKKFPGGDEFEEAYLKKKADALKTIGEDGKEVSKEEEESRFVKQRRIFAGNLMELLKKHYKINLDQISHLMSAIGVDMRPSTLADFHQMCRNNGLLVDLQGVPIINIMDLEEKKKKIKEKIEKMRQEAEEKGEKKVLADISDDPAYNNSPQGVQEANQSEQGVEKD